MINLFNNKNLHDHVLIIIEYIDQLTKTFNINKCNQKQTFKRKRHVVKTNKIRN